MLPGARKMHRKHSPAAPHIDGWRISLLSQQEFRGAVPQCNYFISVWPTRNSKKKD